MMYVDVEIGGVLHQEFKDIVGAHVKLIEHTDESKHTGKTSSSEKTIYLPVTQRIPQNIVVAKITTEQALAMAIDEPVSKTMGLFGKGASKDASNWWWWWWGHNSNSDEQVLLVQCQFSSTDGNIFTHIIRKVTVTLANNRLSACTRFKFRKALHLYTFPEGESIYTICISDSVACPNYAFFLVIIGVGNYQRKLPESDWSY